MRSLEIIILPVQADPLPPLLPTRCPTLPQTRCPPVSLSAKERPKTLLLEMAIVGERFCQARLMAAIEMQSVKL